MGQFSLVRSYNTDLAAPQQGWKWMTSWPNLVLYITFPILYHSHSLLWLLSLCSMFWSFLWTGFSRWLHLTKKGMLETRVILFGQAKANCIITKHVYTIWWIIFYHFIIIILDVLDHSRSLVCCLIVACGWPLMSRCNMICFCYVLGCPTLFILLKGHCHAIWQLYKKLEGAFTSFEFQN